MHIVFDKKDAEALEKSFELDESLRSEVIVVDEDYSVGPLEDGLIEGYSRDEWLAMKKLSTVSENELLENRIKSAFEKDGEEQLWIWIVPNSRDVCGYYWLISRLQDYKGKVFSIWLNNLPFINEKGQIFYPKYLSEIPAKEFLKAKKLALEVSPAIFETDPDEWKKMVAENKPLRLLDGAKKISGQDESFFDDDLIHSVPVNWQKSSKTIQQFLEKSKYTINENFLLWRLRELTSDQKIEAKGDWPDSDNFEVRKNSVENTEEQ